MNPILLYPQKNIVRSLALGFLLFLSCFNSLEAQEEGWSKEKKVFMTNLGGITAITAWGVANWDYFTQAPKKGSEGWFSRDTKEGGADKLAHFYFTYSFSHILTHTFDQWGYPSQKAALLGSLSSFAMMSFMEFGDSFSSYGFSHEDFLMNLLGCATGYLVSRNPSLAKKIDFRIEYIPTFEQADFFSDYDHMKFLMAIKLDGFDWIKNPYARYLELHLGYYARGFSGAEKDQRNIYLGVGLSIPKLFRQFSMEKTAKVFHYYQLPYTYLSLEKELNK